MLFTNEEHNVVKQTDINRKQAQNIVFGLQQGTFKSKRIVSTINQNFIQNFPLYFTDLKHEIAFVLSTHHKNGDNVI